MNPKRKWLKIGIRFWQLFKRPSIRFEPSPTDDLAWHYYQIQQLERCLLNDPVERLERCWQQDFYR